MLDLTGIPYRGSAGLGTLVQESGIAREQGGELRLCGVSERVAELIKMTCMDGLLPTDADVHASLMAVGSAVRR